MKFSSTDEPIHEWFNLTYANYLVLHRTVLQSMPAKWQRRFVALLVQLDDAAKNLQFPYQYSVTCKDERGRFVRDTIPHYERGRARVPLTLPRYPKDSDDQR